MTPNDVKIVADNIDDFIEVPNGVARLRQAVLTLGVSGKLVLQDKKEGTAEELYTQIQKELSKKREGSKKKKKEVLPVSQTDLPFEIPKTWKWVRISELVALITDGEHISPAKHTKGIPLVTAKNVIESGVTFENVDFVTEEDARKFWTRCHPEKGDLLICSRGTIGRTTTVDVERPFCLMGSVILIKFLDKTLSDFCKYYLRTPSGVAQIGLMRKGMAVGALYLKDIEKALIPLPPIFEQKRIIRKIEEVMKQLDELEVKKRGRDEVRARLALSAMQSLGKGESKIAFEQLTELIKTPSDLKELEGALLTLAVSGKLVPQDKKDESAEDLYIQIQAVRVKEEEKQAGLKRKVKDVALITQEEIPFKIPSSWKWVKLNQIGYTNIGLTYSPTDTSDVGTPVLRSTNVQNGQIDLTELVRVKKEVKNSVLVQEGDLLICARNGSKALVGKTAMIRNLKEPMAFGAFMAIYRSAYNPYIEVFLKSPVFRNLLEGVSTTTINQITQDNLKNTLLPLPPLAEQKRIVNKVEEVMALVGKLKQLVTVDK